MEHERAGKALIRLADDVIRGANAIIAQADLFAEHRADEPSIDVEEYVVARGLARKIKTAVINNEFVHREWLDGIRTVAARLN